VTAEADRPLPRVAVVADDLIWATRLAGIVRSAGGEPVPVRGEASLEAALVASDGCLVDLTARLYDGIACLRVATAAGVPAVAVGQHDDAETRRSAREAGASRVWAYRALFERGPAELTPWIARLAAGAALEETDR
jgi:hypothetical protein